MRERIAVDTVEKNQQAFTGQSEGFSSDGDTYADAGELAWMLEELPVLPDAEALDIATGTGEFAACLVADGWSGCRARCN